MMTPKNEFPTHKKCIDCGEIKPFSAFSKNKGAKDGHQSRCKDCQRVVSREWAAAHPDVSKAWKAQDRLDNPEKNVLLRRAQKLRQTYNMTLEDYDALLDAQGGVCGICKTDYPGRGLDSFCVDHDHTCCPGKRSCGECVRGLLCCSCNPGLGFFGDDIEKLIAAVEYLNSTSSRKLRLVLESV